jgi:hypothetical protein
MNVNAFNEDLSSFEGTRNTFLSFKKVLVKLVRVGIINLVFKIEYPVQ